MIQYGLRQYVQMKEKDGSKIVVDINDVSCQGVCPFHFEECIDCGICGDECSDKSLLNEDELPDNWKQFIDKIINLAK